MAAAVLPLLVGYAVLELNPLWEVVSEEVAKFVAFFLGNLMFAAVARSRGCSEISGLMDGIVYGAVLGFGFATGEAFVRELVLGGAIGAGPFATLWTTALVGLFGAVIGAGFGAAAGVRPKEIGCPVTGLAGRSLSIWHTRSWPRRTPWEGRRASRARAALVIPVLLVVAIMVLALVRERRAAAEA